MQYSTSTNGKGATMDQIKFHYEQTDIPNVVIQYDKERAKHIHDKTLESDPNADIPLYNAARISSDAREFISTLAKANPQWTFIGVLSYTAYYPTETPADIESFIVEHKNEQLGNLRIYKTWHNRKQVVKYGVSNQRIAIKRERGSEMVTKDMVRAIRTVQKQFSSKTANEHLGEATEKLVSSMNREVRNHNRLFDVAFSKYIGALQTHILLNLDKFNDIVAPHLQDKSLITELPKLYDRFELAENIAVSSNNNYGTVVVINGGEYMVAFKHDSVVMGFTTDTLPPSVKQHIGMLKLIQDGEFLRDVGYRHDENTYYVVDVKPDEFTK
jgi:hypothetical protein